MRRPLLLLALAGAPLGACSDLGPYGAVPEPTPTPDGPHPGYAACADEAEHRWGTLEDGLYAARAREGNRHYGPSPAGDWECDTALVNDLWTVVAIALSQGPSQLPPLPGPPEVFHASPLPMPKTVPDAPLPTPPG